MTLNEKLFWHSTCTIAICNPASTLKGSSNSTKFSIRPSVIWAQDEYLIDVMKIHILGRNYQLSLNPFTCRSMIVKYKKSFLGTGFNYGKKCPDLFSFSCWEFRSEIERTRRLHLKSCLLNPFSLRVILKPLKFKAWSLHSVRVSWVLKNPSPS